MPDLDSTRSKPAASAPAPFSAQDREKMAMALRCAEQAIGLSDPNPRVGCVIAAAGWQVAAHTLAAGQAHAEAHALQIARAAGRTLRGATVYVTLEPCAHHGLTPPCCDALIEAGVARVVVSQADPNPLVAGRGLARMRDAGIRVEVGLMADEARELNIGFFSRMLRHRPWVRMKIAASLDGRTALNNGLSQWITGPQARADGHAWRRRAGAVLSGVGTVLEDDPRLNVRLVPSARQPWRVVVDSRLQAPPQSRVFDPPGTVLVYAAQDDALRAGALAQRGVRVVLAPARNGKVDLQAMMADLARQGINELHVEAGHKLNASLLRASLVDELLVYLAPTLLGQGREMAAFGPLERLADALPLQFMSVERVGDDLRITARPPGRADF